MGRKKIKKEIEEKRRGEEEHEHKEGSTLSDGVLDAFDEVAPEEEILEEDIFGGNEEDDTDDFGKEEW